MEAENPPKRAKAPLTAAEMFEIQAQSKTNSKISNTSKLMENVKCIQGNKVEQACRSEKCQKQALVCSDKKCECRAMHQKFVCSFVELEDILEEIDKKVVCSEALVEKVEKHFDGLIDEISNQRDKIIGELRCVGLYKVQKQFVQFAKQKKFEDINGKIVSQVTKILNKSKVIVKKDCEQYLYEVMSANLQSLFEIAQSRFSKLSEKLSLLDLVQISKKINKISFGECKIQSNVITAQDQLKNLIQFFLSSEIPLKPQSFELLYCASKHDFQVSKFWEICHGIPNTVVLVKTKNGRIIGGFTPLSWKKDKKQQWQADESGQSFIFSITGNFKLTLKKDCMNRAIGHHSVDTGPQFGQWDLRICDTANSLKCSLADVGHSYSKPGFEQCSRQGWRKFTGKGNTMYFNTFQWEVHQVRFQNNQIDSKKSSIK